jgi:crotonobetainyl-CoA:carnitine CoA-transferase CaiB-like acyl-CoA transferase
MASPLSSLVVLDFTRLLPGPFATLLAADLGARVVKVEDPSLGDYLRWVGPPVAGGSSATFQYLNRQKLGVQLDLKHPGGVLVARRLAARADALIESFRPGVMDRLGLGADDLATENPRLVYVSITGYGQSGPLAARAGHDLNYVSLAGLAGMSGAPIHGPVQLADLVGGGYLAAVALLAGVIEARHTGRGRHMDVAMCHGVQSLMAVQMASYMASGSPPDVRESVLGGHHPTYGYYRCQDGEYLSVAALEPKFWSRLVAALGIPELESAPASPPAEWPAMRRRMAEVFATRTAAGWMEALGPLDCCVERVLALEEARGHPQAASRGIEVRVRASTGETLAQPAPFLRARPELETPVGAAPRPGEHARAVLAEAGFTGEEIDDLAASGAIGPAIRPPQPGGATTTEKAPAAPSGR